MPIKIEDKLHKDFAYQMLQYEFYKKLSCKFWTYMPFGEYRTPTTAGLLKSKGTKTGVPDYLFINVPNTDIDHYIWLEFKRPKIEPKKPAGTQSESQKVFQGLFANSQNTRYYVVYSIKEAEDILIKEGILVVE